MTGFLTTRLNLELKNTIQSKGRLIHAFPVLHTLLIDFSHDNPHFSHVIRKSTFCIILYENKVADQLRGNGAASCAADQHLCFHSRDSTMPQLPKSKI